MKRDYDLVLGLLKDIEDAPPNTRVRIDPADHPDYDKDAINEHLEMMIDDAGLVLGRVQGSGQARVFAIFVERLTWQGHDFLDAARVPGVWEKAKDKIKAAGGSLPFDVVNALVIGWRRTPSSAVESNRLPMAKRTGEELRDRSVSARRRWWPGGECGVSGSAVSQRVCDLGLQVRGP